MDTNSTFAVRLKQLREDAGLSQTQLAERLGVSRGSVSYYEKDERTAGIDFLAAAANYFNVPSDWLLGLTNTRESENVNIGERTGLSDKAIEILQESRRKSESEPVKYRIPRNFDASCIVNYLLTHSDFSEAKEHIENAQRCSWTVSQKREWRDRMTNEENARLDCIYDEIESYGYCVLNPEEAVQSYEFQATKLISKAISEMCALRLPVPTFEDVISFTPVLEEPLTLEDAQNLIDAATIAKMAKEDDHAAQE